MSWPVEPATSPPILCPGYISTYISPSAAALSTVWKNVNERNV
jgi:hypothetical protein